MKLAKLPWHFLKRVLKEIGWPDGFPSADCITLGCIDIFECKATGVCPHLNDEQRKVLIKAMYVPGDY